MGRTTPQNCPFPWAISTPYKSWFLGPNRVYPPSGIYIDRFSHLCRLTNVTNRRPPSVAMSTHLMHATWPKNQLKINKVGFLYHHKIILHISTATTCNSMLNHQSNCYILRSVFASFSKLCTVCFFQIELTHPSDHAHFISTQL